MKRTLFFSCGVAILAMACGYGYETRNNEIVGTTTITSGPGVGQRELPRTLRSTSESVAAQVCKHENRCGRGTVASCVDATTPRAQDELSRWNCDPAAIRARLEECLASFDDLSCDVDLSKEKRPLCKANVACGDRNAKLIPSGPELAKVWR